MFKATVNPFFFPYAFVSISFEFRSGYSDHAYITLWRKQHKTVQGRQASRHNASEKSKEERQAFSTRLEKKPSRVIKMSRGDA